MKVNSKNCAADRQDSLLERFDALAVVDGAGADWSPGSVLVERRESGGLVLAAGWLGEVDRHPGAAAARRVDLPDSVVIPGLVNAHTHLDLTHLGPREFRPEGGFVQWVDMVRTGRHAEDDAIRESVRRGIELSRLGGTVAVGDIAGAPRGRASLAPFEELASSGMIGVSFLEFFGIGVRTEATRERLEALLSESEGRSGGVRLGLQPHAPNTVSIPMYEWAARLGAERGLPLATHLAETVEEREFVARGTGPQREMLERLGVWDSATLEHIGRGNHPVQHLAGVLKIAPFVAAHVNDADDAAIETLARTGTTVAYCPRASAYFGAERHFGPHRYREMIEAGVVVALGTDSLVNLPEAAATEGISVLDEMRFLHQRDATDPRLLLRMGTVNGAVALGMDTSSFKIERGNMLAGLLAIGAPPGSGDPLARVLLGSERPRLIVPAK